MGAGCAGARLCVLGHSWPLALLTRARIPLGHLAFRSAQLALPRNSVPGLRDCMWWGQGTVGSEGLQAQPSLVDTPAVSAGLSRAQQSPVDGELPR